MDSVFIEDIDLYFTKNIKLQAYTPSDSNDPEYPSWKLDTVPVTYHQPEGGVAPDFEANIATFFLYDMALDTTRTQSDIDILVSRNQLQNTIATKKVPIPFKLFYQIDLWSLKQSNMVQMITQFHKNFPPRGSILVPDKNGREHDLYMEMTHSKNADGALWGTGSKQTNERIFRRIFRFCIHAELDNSEIKNNQMVKEVIVIDNFTQL